VRWLNRERRRWQLCDWRWLQVTGTLNRLDGSTVEIEVPRVGRAIWLNGGDHYGFTAWRRRGSLDVATGWTRRPRNCRCVTCRHNPRGERRARG
jgi:hypothetical protein